MGALICAGAQAQDDKAAPDARAAKAVAQMTLDEKIAMLHGNFGSILRKTRPNEKRIGAGHVPGVARLGIPDLYESDGGLGVGNGGSLRPGDVATALPSALAIGASFDPAIAYAGGAMIGAEARAKGFNVLLAGGVNLTRDAWGGRNFEYFGEDVLLSGVMGGESIRGIQSNGIIATAKHFALNSQESGRYVLDAKISEGALRESDLLAFQIAIERGQPGSVMCAYNKVNGDWACENAFLLTDVLRRDWHYPGFVMSDWGGVHSTVKAANAGLDQQSGQELDKAVYFGPALKAAVEKGEVAQSTIDTKVHRILRTMYASGIVDHPAPDTPQQIDYAAHEAVAQSSAEAGIVLLKNERGVLPLAASAKKIVVIGGHADIGVLSGGGSSQVQAVSGSPLRIPIPNGPKNLSFIKTTYQGNAPLAAIRARGADVTYLDGRDVAAATAAARDADVVLVFAEQWRTEALDIETLALPGDQDALIDAVAAANPRTAVVLQTGGAVLMPWLDKVAAVVEAWYPGDRGGEAIARVLFGEIDASGRLPLSFPAHNRQQPRAEIPGLGNVKAAMIAEANKPPTQGATTIDISGGVEGFPVDYVEGADVGYRWFERTGEKPLFPFGHGLSYTRFAYSALKVFGGAKPILTFTIRNVGQRAGTDVPQAYAAVAGADGKMIRRLVGFQRVALKPGESKSVSLTVDPRLIARFDTAKRIWQVQGCDMTFAIGTDAETMVLTGHGRIAASRLRP
ncbi:beta-glucosidase family protein [Sphingobium sp. HWE2-09]|uniref:beta-glucosidase family protein n=1 Tax=Sphingobium sp. HWE2-09 TaxID=3108390 RepID=UPI002DC67F8F|nr:beta-glucosidase [Sphingobium sp. HWE2-09]